MGVTLSSHYVLEHAKTGIVYRHYTAKYPGLKRLIADAAEVHRTHGVDPRELKAAIVRELGLTPDE